MNRRTISFVAATVLGLTAPAVAAVAQSPAPPVSQQQTRAATGPTVSASAVGIQRARSGATEPVAAADKRLGAGRNVAMMVVGGAALIIGAVIGGTAGVLIGVTGAAIGLYGLYNFVQ